MRGDGGSKPVAGEAMREAALAGAWPPISGGCCTGCTVWSTGGSPSSSGTGTKYGATGRLRNTIRPSSPLRRLR